MDTKNIETFIRVAEVGTFSKAAIELGYAQSTVTMQIKQLEIEAGVPLFERQGKRVSLSKEGKVFLNYAYHISKCTSEMKEAFSGTRDPSGVLSIGIPDTLTNTIFSEVVEDFLVRYPETKINLKVADSEGVMDLLKQNQVDFAIVLDKEEKNQEYKVALKREEPFLFICSKKNRLSYGSLWSFSEISGEKFILWTKNKVNFQRAFDTVAEEKNANINPILRTSTPDLIIDAAKRNVGISFAPRIMVASALEREGLHSFKVPEIKENFFTQIIYKKDKWVSPAMKEFIEMSRESLMLIS